MKLYWKDEMPARADFIDVFPEDKKAVAIIINDYDNIQIHMTFELCNKDNNGDWHLYSVTEEYMEYDN